MTAAATKRHVASDNGEIARESGTWAEEKLYYVSRYFYAFNQATKKTFSNRAYIDLLAGSGRCYLKQYPQIEFNGSPLRALSCDAPFTQVLCIERDPHNVAALQRRIAAFSSPVPCQVLAADCNSALAISAARNLLGRRKTLGLIFVDTLGLSDVRFSTLRQLTADRRADLIYTFHVQDVTRNIGQALSDPLEAARFTSSFGRSDWHQAWSHHLLGLSPTVSVADALTTFFESQLKTLGYTYVQPLHRLMKNSKNAPLYRLILASHSQLAAKLWTNVSQIEYSGQRGLLR